MPYDVRSVANFVLDISVQEDLPVSNLSINKIIYFLHGWFLSKFEKPLTTAKIEAWQYGPVFRELYKEFKDFGDEPIRKKAQKIDLSTGSIVDCEYEFSDEERAFLTDLSRKYLRIPAYNLMALSHESGGPWDEVWNHDKVSNPGMRISDELLKAYFSKQAKH